MRRFFQSLQRFTFHEFDAPRARGFTLVEMIVVIAVTTMLASFIVQYSVSGRQSIALQVERAKIGQTIARAKSLAIKSLTSNATECGYGVHFDYGARTYAIVSYADTVGVPPCRMLSVDTALMTRDPNETYELPSGLEFEFAPADTLDAVIFVPPDPSAHIRLTDGTVLPRGNRVGVVYIETADGSVQNAITVNTEGLIDF